MLSEGTEEIFEIEDDSYWIYEFDGYTLRIPKVYEKIPGFDREFIYQDSSIQSPKNILLSTTEYNTFKWDWIREHCTSNPTNPSLLYYTPKKKIDEIINVKTIDNEYVCCLIM